MTAKARPEASLQLETPLRFVRGVGPARAEALAAAGFHSLADLLLHLPRRYEDRRRVAAAREVRGPGPWQLRGRLLDLRAIRTRRRGLVLVRALCDDGDGAVPVIWFNQPYLAQRLDPGLHYRLYGSARPAEGGRWELINPSCELIGDEETPGGLVAVYPPLPGLGSKSLARLIGTGLPLLDPPDAPPDPLPAELRRRYALPSLAAALLAVHRPADDGGPPLEPRATPGHARLVYGELLEFQLELALRRKHLQRREKGHRYRIDDRVRERVRELLPFRLTGAQRRVLKEIADDLVRPTAMRRLLQGDVGSGKTIVAAIALVLAVESGLQGAFMAPTELLAEQHFANLERLLGGRYRLALVSSSRRLASAQRALAAGEVQLAVGTHALIQDKVQFQRLGLAVIDEQHRFGVEQRSHLERKGQDPDLLVMTATPIPRSLALTVYGDLELSTLDELPPGRTAVRTELAPASARPEIYRRLRAELEAGAQAYVVMPLIEESEHVPAASLAALGEKVKRLFGDLPTATLHGRVDATTREQVMREFAAGRLRVLIATTLIEVGIDVPTASAMVIESAERFGLAQLHQLRGRVGRGSRPSICFALHGRLSAETRLRLETFAATQDGFRLAEADLEARGPGDLLGTRQTGLPAFRLADLLRDRAWLERARRDAGELAERLDSDPALALLRERVLAKFERRAALGGGG